MPKIIKVIVSEFEREGRTVTQYHTLKGKFLAESDPGPRALFTNVGLEPTSLFWPRTNARGFKVKLEPNTNPVSRGMDIDDPVAEYKTEISTWAGCAIDGCPHKVCTWGSHDKCYPHEESLVGKAEMNRRFDATHAHPWHALTPQGNPMLRTFAEIEDSPEDELAFAIDQTKSPTPNRVFDGEKFVNVVSRVFPDVYGPEDFGGTEHE